MKSYTVLIISFFYSSLTTGQGFFFGCKFNDAEYAKVAQEAPLTSRSYEVLPSEFSLKRFCPTPGKQNFFDCVGWATAYASRTIVESITNNWESTGQIDGETFSPSYIYNQIKLSEGCEDGSYIHDALGLLAKQGVPTYKDHMYGCDIPIDNYTRQLAQTYKISDYRRLNGLKSIKKAIANNNPVIIGMYVSEGFGNTIGDLWDGSQKGQGGGHAMCIVGYNDDKYGGAFEVMNSWGTGFANKGFVWICYNDLLRYVNQVYEVIPLPVQIVPHPNDPKIVKKISLSGELNLVLDNGDTMKPLLCKNKNDSINENPTYKLITPYKSGTKFRILFGTRQHWAYIYLISYGTKTKDTQLIFPFDNYSPYIGKSSEVAVPNEQYYIELDDNVGKDYLCLLYSSTPLNIMSIMTDIKFNKGSFSYRVKKSIQDEIVESPDINFDQQSIGFLTKSTERTVVPIIIEFDHVK